MKRTLFFAAAAVALFTGPVAIAQMAPPPAQEFVTMAASSDMFEIQSSTAALERAESAEVKQFAQMMIDDHTEASEDLLAAIQQSGEDLEAPGAMTEKHQEQIDTLNAVTGTDFDAAYVDAQVAAHEEALALMTSYAEGGDNEALKAHAEKTAHVVQTHLEHVQQLDQSM